MPPTGHPSASGTLACEDACYMQIGILGRSGLTTHRMRGYNRCGDPPRAPWAAPSSFYGRRVCQTLSAITFEALLSSCSVPSPSSTSPFGLRAGFMLLPRGDPADDCRDQFENTRQQFHGPTSFPEALPTLRRATASVILAWMILYRKSFDMSTVFPLHRFVREIAVAGTPRPTYGCPPTHTHSPSKRRFWTQAFRQAMATSSGSSSVVRPVAAACRAKYSRHSSSPREKNQARSSLYAKR